MVWEVPTGTTDITGISGGRHEGDCACSRAKLISGGEGGHGRPPDREAGTGVCVERGVQDAGER